MSEWVDVAAADEFFSGGRRVVDVDGVAVIVFNLDGNYYAIEDLCTHDYQSMSEGKIEGDNIVCPWHGARFCIKTGQAMTPPAFEPVHVFPVRVHYGKVQVRDDRWD